MPQPTVLGVVGEPPNGVTYIRFLQPFDHLRELGFELRTLGANLPVVRTDDGLGLPADFLDGVDLVMFPQMVASPFLPDGSRVELVEWICEDAGRRGIPVVYSVDDHLAAIADHNPACETVRRSFHNSRTLLERADALIVTTPPLRDTLARSGKPVYLLPNAVEPKRWRRRSAASRVPRVGWSGSASHAADLLLIVPAIRKLQRRVPCRFVLQGLTPERIDDERCRVRRLRPELSGPRRTVADLFLDLVSALDDVDYLHVPFTPVEAFFRTLPSLDLDIGICPLLDNEFNRHKSANKFYEYAITGSLTVASAVAPYLEEVSVTVPEDPVCWAETLEHYLRGVDVREEELERQRAFVLEHRNIETLRHDWAAVLGKILESSREEVASPSGSFDAVRASAPRNLR